MEKTNLKGRSKVGSKRAALVLLALLAIGQTVSAENAAVEAKNRGVYLSLPAYLFGDFSALGIQGGYQFSKANLRFDMNLVNEYGQGEIARFLMPSVGLFFSRDWQAGIRIYQGTTVGVEFGMQNSFDGQVYFINYVVGAELLSFGKSTFFFEIGPSMDIAPKEGAFNGGTVIGGGMRRFF